MQHEQAAYERPGVRARRWLQDVSNIVKSFLGSNFIGTPYAISQAGYVAGPVGVALIAFVAWHACVLLLQVKRTLHEQQWRSRGGVQFDSDAASIVSYGDLARAVFGRAGVWTVNCFLVFTQMGFCVGYTIFIASNGLALLGVDPSRSLYSWPHVLAVLASAALCLLLSLVRSVRTLGYVSALAALCLFASIVAIVAGEFRFAAAADAVPLHFSGLLVFADMTTSALEGIGTVLPVQASMSAGRLASARYERLFAPVMLLVVLVLAGFGVCGYLSYGSSTNAVITLNFRPSPLSTAVQLAITLAVLGTFPLQLVPVVDVVRPGRRSRTADYLIRLLLVAVVAAVAYALPFFGLISALVGSLGSSFLMFIFPPLAMLKLQLRSQPYLSVVKNAALLAFGLIIAVVGGASAIRNIARAL